LAILTKGRNSPADSARELFKPFLTKSAGVAKWQENSTKTCAQCDFKVQVYCTLALKVLSDQARTFEKHEKLLAGIENLVKHGSLIQSQ